MYNTRKRTKVHHKGILHCRKFFAKDYLGRMTEGRKCSEIRSL